MAVSAFAVRLRNQATIGHDVVDELTLVARHGRQRRLRRTLIQARDRAVDQLRRRRLEQRHAADGHAQPLAAAEDDPEQQAWGKFRAEALSRALASLPPSQRVALELAYLRGMTQAEIAACLGEPLGTIKTRTRLAMQKLRASPELVALVRDAG